MTLNTTGVANQITQTPTYSDPVIQKIASEIREYEKVLSFGNLSTDEKINIETKLKLARGEFEKRQEILNSTLDIVTIKNTLIAEATQKPPQPKKTDEHPVGVFEDPPHLKEFREATFTTVWIAPYQGTYIQIYAGRMIDEPDQGVLAIVIEGNNNIEKYFSPKKDGELRIIKFDKGKLFLKTKRNSDILFDPDLKVFLDKDGNPWIVMTPLPSPQPYPAP